MRLFKILILICVSITLNSQACTCLLYESSKDDIALAMDSNDSLALKNILESIKRTASPYCEFMAMCEEIKFCTENRAFGKAAKMITGAEKLASKLKCKTLTDHQLLLLKADYYQERDSIETAMKFAIQLLSSAEKSRNSEDILSAISQIGTLYVRQDQDKAFKPFLYKAKRIIGSLPESKKHAEYYNWLARYYETEFAAIGKKSALDTTEIFANMAYQLANKYKQHRQLQYVFQVFDAIAYHKGDYKKSLAFQDSVYKYMRINKANGQIPVYFQTKALTLLEVKDKVNTILHQDSAIYYARKYSQTSFLANILKQGAELYEAAGDKDRALSALKEFSVLRDTLNTEKRTKIINELEQKYQKENNEKKILELSNQRNVLWIGLLLASILGLSYYFWARQREFKQNRIIMETEQRLNRARMNPHFFFNALASLQSFAINESDSILLAENLSKFSHIMRETLENTYREYVSIGQEEAFLNEYLELQQLRFPGKFDFHLKIDPSFVENNLLIPSMIVQPFIENSIEHGFADIAHRGILNIDFAKENDEIIITVYDNGRGLNYSAADVKPYISRASQIIKDRIYLLNMKLKSKATFSIRNNTLDGVTVIIKLPLIYED